MNDDPAVNPSSSDESATAPLLESPIPETPRRFTRLRRCLACNPFYLVSAALLLFGIVRISNDTSFLLTEQSQLTFNFISLEVYEILLVATAILLARRCIWYDSTLLAALENMFLFIPFILLSQAALIEQRIIWGLSLTAALLAATRFAGLKRFFTQLNLPGRALSLGAIILAVNATLPIVYRTLHQTKFGTKLNAGPAYLTNEYVWLFVLPALVALVIFLPRLATVGERPPERSWLPAGFLAAWLTATVVHLYCLGYVYDFDRHWEWAAPSLWVLAWIVVARLNRFLPERLWSLQPALLPLPALITLLAASALGNAIFLVLTMLNMVAYGVLFFRPGRNRLALHLCFGSLIALLAGVPEHWTHPLLAGFSHESCAAMAAAGYFVVWTAMSRNPKLAIMATFLIVASGCAFAQGEGPMLPWAIQGGLVFLLLHSLRWDDQEYQGAAVVRQLTALCWVAHCWAWAHSGDMPWMVCLPGLIVLVACVAARWWRGHWEHFMLLPAAALAILAGPANLASSHISTIPDGLLAVCGSFALFGLGTILALTKHHWHPK
jgi:hypothetical protein